MKVIFHPDRINLLIFNTSSYTSRSRTKKERKKISNRERERERERERKRERWLNQGNLIQGKAQLTLKNWKKPVWRPK